MLAWVYSIGNCQKLGAKELLNQILLRILFFVLAALGYVSCIVLRDVINLANPHRTFYGAVLILAGIKIFLMSMSVMNSIEEFENDPS